VGKWESRSDFQGSAAAGFSTTQLETAIHAFCMAGSKVTLYGRFWVTPEVIDSGNNQGLWSAMKEMEPRYHLKCPKCSSRFWIKPSQAKTSLFDGSLQGFRCPEKRCGATVAWEEK